MPTDTEYLLLRMRNAIADKEAATACANRELAVCGDWSTNWACLIQAATQEFDSAAIDYAMSKEREDHE